jgi:hypothetical protein
MSDLGTALAWALCIVLVIVLLTIATVKVIL